MSECKHKWSLGCSNGLPGCFCSICGITPEGIEKRAEKAEALVKELIDIAYEIEPEYIGAYSKEGEKKAFAAAERLAEIDNEVNG